ncbi:GroES-like protein [Saccharata proteae CBS 121410]|uniref:GroES-like protein n=1 Tax=Saccharata proteae CBS 121410 TaxID=1314787 RepID=A0A6A5YAW5_9PEZI|nr:GroES-like protein [Saccharata proteae CBS 121410]
MGIQDVPDSMLAAQIVEYNKPYKIHQVHTPKDLGPHDLLVKVAVASLCHTDSMVASGVFGTKLPCIASHEGAGTIAALGPQVKGFAEGDRVMCGLPKHQCGICENCVGPETYRQYCPNMAGNIGVNIDGAFAEYVVIDGRNAAKLPERVTFETAAPLACAGCTIWRGVLQADLKTGEWLAIVGSGGGLGHLGIQFAKGLGLQVIGIDARDEGLSLSKEAGADIVVDARKGKDEVVKAVQAVTSGQGANATINVSDAKSAAATACAVTKMHGLMVQIAQPDEVSIPFPEIIFRDIRIHGSLMCSPDEARRMLDVVAEHRVSVTTNPVHGLLEIPKLLELAHSGKMRGKGIVIVDQDQVDKVKKSGLEMV